MPKQNDQKVIPSASSAGGNEIRLEKKFETPKLLRGMKDILPNDEPYWNTILDATRAIAESYGFGTLRTPVLEATKLFVRSVGKHTDIVEKEMYTFEDADTERVTLRPEATASMVRAYITHGMFNQPQPVKLWQMGSMFRHERPQAGRFRQFHQLDFEVIGSAEPAIDALLLNIAYILLKDVGIDSLVHVNSIGCRECRPLYIEGLIAYYRNNRSKVCEDCKKRLTRNPFRVLDCKQEQCREVKENAPQIIDKLCEPCKKHFMQVLEFCDELGVPYFLNPYLVRGLDYYNRTVFECMPIVEEGVEVAAQSAFGGGGRYDYLVEHLGGRPTPAAGFAHGIERIISELHRKNIAPSREKRPQIFVAQLGELARRKAMAFFEELRREGFRVRECFVKSALRDQMKVADKCKAPFSLILGQREVMEDTIIVRDMDSGVQEIVGRSKIIQVIKKKLEFKEQEFGSLEFMPAKKEGEDVVDEESGAQEGLGEPKEELPAATPSATDETDASDPQSIAQKDKDEIKDDS